MHSTPVRELNSGENMYSVMDGCVDKIFLEWENYNEDTYRAVASSLCELKYFPFQFIHLASLLPFLLKI